MLASVLLTIVGSVCLLAAGFLLNADILTAKDKNKPISYRSWLGLVLCLIALGLFWKSYDYHYSSFAGKMITPAELDEDMIYEVATQVVIPEVGNATVVTTAKRIPRLVGPQKEPINPASHFVRAGRSQDGKWILEPLDVPAKTAKE